MDELELVRAFRRADATVSPLARKMARDRLAALMTGEPSVAASAVNAPVGLPDEPLHSHPPASGLDASSITELGAERRFNDEQEVYEYIGKLFQEIADDKVVFEQFQRAGVILQLRLRRPASQITLKAKVGEVGQVDFGPTDLVPDLVMTMDAETANNFCLGKINLTVALGRGQIGARGPVAKVLKLLPLVRPIFSRYEGPARTTGERFHAPLSRPPPKPDEGSDS